MKAIFVLFDSLNRHYLSPYGCDWVQTPNFRRLAERTVTFDRSYVGSMPCMPARRDLQTGRLSFFHRSWGPLEPFDCSVPEVLKQSGIWSHLCTDHYHYFEEGGTNYHTRFSSWEFFRGQEGDPWNGLVELPPRPAGALGQSLNEAICPLQDWRNRERIQSDQDMPMTRTFGAGMDFIRRNRGSDNWFLQIETFDPHEPFFTLPEHKRLYAEHYDAYRGAHFDWPGYQPVTESPEEVEHVRYEYASLVSLCDQKLGELLDLMDEENLWEDTLLIVGTDHGFMLGEHQSWAKNWCPLYEEVAHTPFFVWDPRSGKQGERRKALVQPCIDVPVTLLNYFGKEPVGEMTGVDLAPAIAEDTPVRDYAMFGFHGFQVNITDGRHVYFRGPENWESVPSHEYTLMPANMRHTFPVDQFVNHTEMHPGFDFTRGCPVMQIGKRFGAPTDPGKKEFATALYDLEKDPSQENPFRDAGVEGKLIEAMRSEMGRHDAPPELYSRLGMDA